MRGQRFSSLALTVVLLAISAGPALSADLAATTNSDIMRQQFHLQGRMLLGYLRRAREAGVSRDPWGMDYALQEALKLSYTLLQTAPQLRVTDPSSQAGPPVNAGEQELNVPLEEGLDIDASLPSGRWEEMDELDQEAGSIPLKTVHDSLERAHEFLLYRPPALGAALLATNQALGLIHWRQGVEPLPWAKARDQLLKAYALALDSHPEAVGELARAQDLLAGLPDGQVYARNPATLMNNPMPDLRALRSLLRQVDIRVATMRDEAEQTRFDGMGGRPGQP